MLTLNPAWPGPEYETSYLRAWPWELRELGESIPDGWRIPAVPATAIGRNVALFQWAVKEAHRPRAAEVIRFHGSKDCPYWEQIVAAKNHSEYGSRGGTTCYGSVITLPPVVGSHADAERFPGSPLPFAVRVNLACSPCPL